MIKRIILSIVVGVITALVVALVGIILIAVGIAAIGAFVKGAATIIGLLAAVWFFFTDQTPARM